MVAWSGVLAAMERSQNNRAQKGILGHGDRLTLPIEEWEELSHKSE